MPLEVRRKSDRRVFRFFVTATFAHISIAHCIDLIDSLHENPDTEHTRFGRDFIRQKDWISRNSSNFGDKKNVRRVKSIACFEFFGTRAWRPEISCRPNEETHGYLVFSIPCQIASVKGPEVRSTYAEAASIKHCSNC